MIRAALLLLTCAAGAMSAPAAATPRQVLILSIHDYRGLYPTDGPELAELVRSLDARAQIRVADVAKRDRPGGVRLSPARLAAAANRAIEGALASPTAMGPIDLLVILTHGSTNTIDGATVSNTDLGYWGEDHASLALSKTLAPLRGRFAPGARVVFNTCEVFCGDAQSAIARGKYLLDFLRIENGTIYGSRTEESNTYLPRGGRPRPRLDRASLALIAAGIGTFAATLDQFGALPYPFWETFSANPKSKVETVLNAIGYGAILFSGGRILTSGLEWTLQRPLRWLQDRAEKRRVARGELNQGYLVKIRDGVESSAESINKNASLDRIFGLGECALSLDPRAADLE